MIDPNDGHTCWQSPCPVCETAGRYTALRARESKLFTASNARGWGLGEAWRHTVHVHTMPPEYGASTPAALFSRGFISHVTCTLAAFVGGPCGRCEGTGQIRSYHPVEIEHVEDCPDCRGTGHTTGIAAALFGAHPVTGVTLTDREPTPFRGRVGSDTETTSGYGWESMSVGPATVCYPTRDAAMLALSRALVAHGRSVAAGWTHEVPCEECEGDGLVENPDEPDGSGLSTCPDCRGTGTATRPGLVEGFAGDARVEG